MDRRPEMRRTMTLSEQLSTPDLTIREFLKIPGDVGYGDADAGRSAQEEGGRSAGGMINYWKPLRDRLRLRRAASAWLTPSPKPPTTASGDGSGSLSSSNSGRSRSNKYISAAGEATAAFSRTTSLRPTPTFSRATSTRVGPTATIGRAGRGPAVVDAAADDEASEDGSEDDEDEEEGNEDAAPAAQMSLMALLEQTDSTWDDDDDEEDGPGYGASKNALGGGVGGGDDDEDDGEGREEEMVHVCCVCMVRHKGAAFIPCGHTFCRLCSRELWVSRGNCPLCNGFIQEILDIF